jgi:light-regulated signal transduction histidine kinase (bacteriophytochrome)
MTNGPDVPRAGGTGLRREISPSRAEALERELAERSEELRRANDDSLRVCYAVSHDLRELLRAVRGSAELLARRYGDALDAEGVEHLRTVLESSARMDSLLDDVLVYARLAHGPVRPLSRVPCELALNCALDRVGPAITENNAVVTHDPLPLVTADEADLVLLFTELLDNAVKFRGPEPPRIHISALGLGAEWSFAVRDNGQGIDAAYHSAVFDVARRLHGRDYPGNGMGLAIARKIVERHGGRIHVESEAGRGAAVHFTLPA